MFVHRAAVLAVVDAWIYLYQTVYILSRRFHALNGSSVSFIHFFCQNKDIQTFRAESFTTTESEANEKKT